MSRGRPRRRGSVRGLFIWLIALALFVAWLIGLLLGKGGFLHILILCAVAVAVVQWVADRRAARG